MNPPAPKNFQPTRDELVQMLRDAVNQLGCVLKAIALHPEFTDIMKDADTPNYKYADYTPDTPPADTAPAVKSEMFCANCGTSHALDGWTLCYECANDIAFESYEIEDEIMFAQEAKQIVALYDDEDGTEDGDSIDTVDE
jgi:hypothetical protein